MKFSTDDERRIAVIFLAAIKNFYQTAEGQTAYEKWLQQSDQKPQNETDIGSQNTDTTN